MTADDEVAVRLLADLRVEIARADSKAALLVGALGLTAGVVSGQQSGPRRAPVPCRAAACRSGGPVRRLWRWP